MTPELLNRISNFLMDASEFNEDMNCEIKWENGEWTIEISDGSTEGKSDGGCDVGENQFIQALNRYSAALERWIKSRIGYGHKVTAERKIMKLVVGTMVKQ